MRHGHSYIPEAGVKVGWLLGLPCWLIGCRLAQNAPQIVNTEASKTKLWVARIGIYLGSIAVAILAHSTPVKQFIYAIAFALLTAAWLKIELAWCLRHEPKQPLERLGLASYSIYLVHISIAMLLAHIAIFGQGLAMIPVEIVVTLAVCYVFFLVVERPSHILARRLGAGAVPAPKNVEPDPAALATEA